MEPQTEDMKVKTTVSQKIVVSLKFSTIVAASVGYLLSALLTRDHKAICSEKLPILFPMAKEFA